jgi:hypothetical protein
MKEQLIAIINSYGAARASGDALLQQLAASQLTAFLESVEITPKSAEDLPAAEQ